MNARGADLATQLETANAAVIAAVEGCSDEQWKRITESEQWPVGVTARHVAINHLPLAGFVELIATGGEIPPITMDMIHANNAQHAQEHANCTQAEVLELLRRDGSAAAEKLRNLSDEQLARTASLALLGGAEMSATQIAENILLRHPYQHLESIQATVGN